MTQEVTSFFFLLLLLNMSRLELAPWPSCCRLKKPSKFTMLLDAGLSECECYAGLSECESYPGCSVTITMGRNVASCPLFCKGDAHQLQLLLPDCDGR